MRTTVDIPDAIYRRLKARAALERRSVKDLILESVQAELRSGKQTSRRRRVKLPIIASRDPGTLQIDNAGVYEFIPFP